MNKPQFFCLVRGLKKQRTLENRVTKALFCNVLCNDSGAFSISLVCFELIQRWKLYELERLKIYLNQDHQSFKSIFSSLQT